MRLEMFLSLPPLCASRKSTTLDPPHACLRMREKLRSQLHRNLRRPFVVACGVCVFILILAARPAHAYIGPGAGFALLSSFFVLFTTIALIVLSVLAWPLRLIWWMATTTRTKPASARRLIIIGFDGQDPTLTDRFLSEDLLQNLKKLAESGSYRRLRTTLPSVSPVAWSSFSTGCEPGRHNIFDFIGPDRRAEGSTVPLGSRPRIFRYRPLSPRP